MERETRFELATLALARRCSTTELLPLVARLSIPGGPNPVKLRRVALEPHLFPSPRAQSPRRAYAGCVRQSKPLQGCE